jgi:hypothetical protein
LNDLYGWGATIVDGLDTAIVMNLTAIVTKQLALSPRSTLRMSKFLIKGVYAAQPPSQLTHDVELLQHW